MALGLVVLAALIDVVSPGPGGPTGSSYATSPSGLSAYATLLGRFGHPVSRLRIAPAQARLRPSSTVIVLDPTRMVTADVIALRRFVVGGGRLIAGGQDSGLWLSKLLGDPPSWLPTGAPVSEPLLPVSQTEGVGSVLSAGEGGWSNGGATLAVLGNQDAALLAIATLGRGTVELLADSSPLQNRLLGRADNAQLGLRLAGPASRPVVFEEAVHGYGEGNGVAGLPARWKWALIGLGLAALAGVAARARRLGPPDPPGRTQLPGRRAHVDALASALLRTGEPGQAAAPLWERARQHLTRLAGLEVDATPEALADAGRRLGLAPDQIRALTSPRLVDSDVLTVGRALAELRAKSSVGQGTSL